MTTDDELNFDLDNIETKVENKLKVKNRFEELSEKVILTSKERDIALGKAKESEDARLAMEKELGSIKSFNTVSSKYPDASQFQDQILEKVNKGYDLEDATLAVLAKEGKLSGQTVQVQRPAATVEGGSAPTIIQGNKAFNDMTMDDKKAELSKLSNDELAKAFRS